MKALLLLVGLASCAVSLLGQGSTLWNESVNGPLGDNPSTATPLGTLLPGTNSIWAASEAEPFGSSWIVFADYYTFDAPVGYQISEILFSANRNMWVWLGGDSYQNQIGFAQNPANGDLVPKFGQPPFVAGSYSMYTLNNDLRSTPTTAHYRLDFVVTPVPEPAAWALLALGGAALWALRRRRGK